jgi:hypothetical protein
MDPRLAHASAVNSDRADRAAAADPQIDRPWKTATKTMVRPARHIMGRGIAEQQSLHVTYRAVVLLLTFIWY